MRHHTIFEFVAFGSFKDQKCLIVLSGEEANRTLIVAFRGSQNTQDWKDNFSLGVESDPRFPGRFHSGFLNRMKTIELTDIQKLAYIHKATMVVTCGHSLGGAISSLIHLALMHGNRNRSTAEEITHIMKDEDFVNFTFGAPMFGNKFVEEHAIKNGYIKQMYHFVSVQDIVPTVLSLGHTVATFDHRLRDLASHASWGLSEIAYQSFKTWGTQNRDKIELAANVFHTMMNMFTILPLDNSSDIRRFFSSYKHLKASVPSTLANEFENHDYIPIGRYLVVTLLDESRSNSGVHIEDMSTNSPKFVERIIQFATESTSPFNVLEEHMMETYEAKIKDYFGGLQSFPGANIRLHKMPTEGLLKSFDFELQSQFYCGFGNGCNECDGRVPLYENDSKNFVLCTDCQKDLSKEEYYFHTDCFRKYHEEGTKSQHFGIPLDFEAYKCDANDVKKLMAQSSKQGQIMLYRRENRNDGTILEGFGRYILNFGRVLLVAEDIEKLASAIAQNKAAVQALTRGYGEIVERSVGASSFKANGYVSLAIFGTSTTINFAQWCMGKITGEEFARNILLNIGRGIGSAIASFGGEKLGAYLGSFFGPIGTLLGACLGSMVGGFLGSNHGQRITEFLANKCSWLRLPEDEQKANAFVESLFFLDIPLSDGDIRQLTEEDLGKAFRKKALIFHPDKQVNASEEERKQAVAAWQALDMAHKMLLTYCENRNIVNSKTIDLINKKWKAVNKKITVDELMKTFEKVKSTRAAGTISAMDP